MRGKHIIVAVSAGIAAYKAIEVVSRLHKKGAEVKVVMTQNATYIASPLTFGEISGHPVALDMFEQVHQWDVEHIALATWADAYVVVPATANVIGKIYAGIADDMLTTTIMATTAPKYLCPAMNTEMYNNPITQRNLEGLRSLGYHIMEPAEGWLACGITGVGRLPEPEAIVEWLESKMCSTNELEGTTILVTAGGTQESIDPVRYIGNRSSGKMGYAIAEQAARMGAKVILVSAPTSLPVPSGVDFVSVDSAVSMQEAVEARFNDVNVVIMAAAVSDFRVLHKAEQKIKKMESMTIELVKNPDILQGLGSKKSHQILVGFAAETEHVIKYGQDKVAKKNLDMLVANDVSKSNAGFNVDTNEGYFLYPDKEPKEMPNMKKSDLARHILREVIDLVANRADIN
ncbi:MULTISPECIES: bifunctional phosphopantothenoylcysteine decarboxylase/phosphopantothenate--cysteine ligase CoaBC [Veillonella]|uniref:bifunctional phosphopantothenoylcysteine decarboxylase/phosphopantothenate--cysteine ligase CoaBC n=1 Tax=Veillonella TaxID=29465 RepID=UPI002914D383|nr:MULTISPECIES: bifunctional phosphopantothenoylcysteine decarboxylase/phosphopantothenate--cysteine ligase CoaBC [Veillonella]MDU3885930.1 bifunctional phosphopantothenoylcysteine decarboxylase/phosphopantothenate--cysteine ligase CoaBC [Veillonella sp.]MDU4111585.1 bifunctional phosphopantothenoylcysteine decarboxylase/phosphopantothenate--cysteine ligase CoaBC [Veillonella parvula]MDU4140444.1 bifunctional phosphopantothenoylcysteine decarboxylase/phosphopantothenate--cysteine ligase CoaBC [